MENKTEVITIRQSQSVFGHFTVYLEKGRNRVKLASGLTEAKAMEVAKEQSRLLKLELHTYLRHPDLDTDAGRLCTSALVC